MYFEILILVVLVMVNGALAMSELAIVSARPARLKARGGRGADQALKLAQDPGRFLSTVQIGITLVGVLSGAFSGATLGLRATDALQGLGLSANLAQAIGVGGVVMLVTYLSLVVGELVPKQVALANPERIATRVAPAMAGLAIVAAPLVWVLDRSGKAILRLLGKSDSGESKVSDDEIKMLIAEAETAGVLKEGETTLINGVMRIADRNAKGLMTPRPEVITVGINDSLDEIRARMAHSGRSRLLVRDGGPDEIVGIVSSRSLVGLGAQVSDLRDVMLEAPVIHESLPALKVVERLRNAPDHTLLVYDEYGHFEGIITAMDVLGAIAGGFDEAEAHESKLVAREDGSLLVSGWMPIDEFAEHIKTPLPPNRDFETVAGLVIHLAAELPEVGKKVQFGTWIIEVVDMDGRRIDKLLVFETRR